MSWTNVKTDQNPFWLWGYIQNPDGSPIAPRIRVVRPDGTSYGDLYTGDNKGVFNLAIPSSDWTIEIMTNGNKTWRGPAYMVSGGTTKMVAGDGVTTQTPTGSPTSNPDGSGKKNTWIWIAAAGVGGLGLAMYKKWIPTPKFLKRRR